MQDTITEIQQMLPQDWNIIIENDKIFLSRVKNYDIEEHKDVRIENRIQLVSNVLDWSEQRLKEELPLLVAEVIQVCPMSDPMSDPDSTIMYSDLISP